MIGLSKSTLSAFKDCPRCFWLAKNKKLEKPRSPMPSIVNAIDATMKKSVENSLIMGNNVLGLDGVPLKPFMDRAKVEGFRNWRTFQAVIEHKGVGVKLWGELDDLLVDDAGIVSPWDFKSKDECPDEDYCQKWYQLDGDMYHLLLQNNGLKCSGLGYLTFCYPRIGEDGEMAFGFSTIQMVTDPLRAAELAYQAAKCLEGKIPNASPDCKMCSYVRTRMDYDQ